MVQTVAVVKRRSRLAFPGSTVKPVKMKRSFVSLRFPDPEASVSIFLIDNELLPPQPIAKKEKNAGMDELSGNLMTSRKKKSAEPLRLSHVLAVVVIASLLVGLSALLLFATPPQGEPLAIFLSQDTQPDGKRVFKILKTDADARVDLANYAVEIDLGAEWKSLGRHSFQDRRILERQRELTIPVDPPPPGQAWRVCVQYGLATRGLELWRERAGFAWRNRRFRDAFRLEQWEARETVGPTIRSKGSVQ